MYGFKGTDENMCCLGYKYKLGQIFKYDKEVKLCFSGFHYCDRLRCVGEFYRFYDSSRYFLIETDNVIEKSGDKNVTNMIRFIEEIKIDDIDYLLEESEYKEVYRENIDGLFLYCIRYGNLYILKKFEKYNVDLSDIGNYALSIACLFGYRDIIMYLIDNNVKVCFNHIKLVYKNNYIEVLEMFDELLKNTPIIINDMRNYACLHNQFELLKFSYKYECPFYNINNGIEYALKFSGKEIIEFLKTKKN